VAGKECGKWPSLPLFCRLNLGVDEMDAEGKIFSTMIFVKRQWKFVEVDAENMAKVATYLSFSDMPWYPEFVKNLVIVDVKGKSYKPDDDIGEVLKKLLGMILYAG
jgi:hypothetical protein